MFRISSLKFRNFRLSNVKTSKTKNYKGRYIDLANFSEFRLSDLRSQGCSNKFFYLKDVINAALVSRTREKFSGQKNPFYQNSKGLLHEFSICQ